MHIFTVRSEGSGAVSLGFSVLDDVKEQKTVKVKSCLEVDAFFFFFGQKPQTSLGNQQSWLSVHLLLKKTKVVVNNNIGN